MTRLFLAFAVLLFAAPLAAAPMPLCGAGPRVTCIVDGDTFWLDGRKVRIADINTPETGQPACPREAELGRRATLKLQALLSAGPLELAPAAGGPDADRFGRLLRLALRDGRSLGDELVAAGLAEPWRGRRSSWC